MTLEHAYIGKEFERYQNNFGYEAAGNPVASAFSHWTYETFRRSAYPLVVNDLQGAGGETKEGRACLVFTDPAISVAGANLEFVASTNFGQAALNMFCASHVCNEVCKQMKLPALAAPSTSGLRTKPTRLQGIVSRFAGDKGKASLGGP